MEHVQQDKNERKERGNAHADMQAAPLMASGPVVRDDHAYQLFVAERQGALLDGTAPAASNQLPA